MCRGRRNQVPSRWNFRYRSWTELLDDRPDVRHYDNDVYPYYDLNALSPLRERNIPFAYPILRGSQEEHPAAFVNKLSRQAFGVHPTRPIVYHPRGRTILFGTGVDRCVEGSDIINPGNVVYDARGLLFPFPLAGLGLRMSGPMTGEIMATIEPGVVRRAFLPLFHNRSPASEAPEYRAGVSLKGSNADEARRQILGDFALRISQLCRIRRVDFSNAATVADEAAETVASAYTYNSQVALGVLSNVRELTENCSWVDSSMREGVSAFTQQVADAHMTLEPNAVVKSLEAERVVAAFHHIPQIYRTWRVLLDG